MKSQAKTIDAKSLSSNSNHTICYNDAQFVFFDAYDKESLDWLQSIAEKRSAKNLFLVAHPPVVPYGARATWHLYSDEKSSAKRVKLLEILGNQTAIVLGGHLHKFSALTRVVGQNKFTQLAVSSVISALDETPRDFLYGVDKYTSDQVKLELQHSPTTEPQRREIYERERKQVDHFEYANSAGFAVVTIKAGRVKAAIHSGSRQTAFRQVLLEGP